MTTENRKHETTTIFDVLIHNADDPTKDELIAIARKMANDHKFKRVTRDGFRSATQLADAKWAKHFGSFPAFMESAGLNTTAGVRKTQNQIARHARQDYIRSVSEERMSWGEAFVRPGNGERWKTVMACSDVHDLEADPFAVRMFVEKCRQAQPDVICVNGDLFDLPEFSKHPKDPREWKLIERLNAGLEFLAELRLVCPKAQIDLIEGNHEARMVKFLSENDPAMMSLLHDMHGMDVQKLFRLNDYEVNYVAKGDLMAFTDAQLRNTVQSSERIYWDCLLARHHPPAKKHPAAMAGFNGHHHQHLVHSYYNHMMGSYEWHQTGGMHKRQASYTEADMKWNCGFIYAIIDTKFHRVNFDYTYVGDTGCQMGGQFYERKPEEFYPGLIADLERFGRTTVNG